MYGHFLESKHPSWSPTGSSPSTLTGKVNQLELILRQLQHDLRKVSLHTSNPSLNYVPITIPSAADARLDHSAQNRHRVTAALRSDLYTLIHLIQYPASFLYCLPAQHVSPHPLMCLKWKEEMHFLSEQKEKVYFTILMPPI